MGISSGVKLAVYNDALRILGERRLASLSEDREPRRVLDDAWGPGSEGVVNVLEMADWNFATRTVQLHYDPGVEPPFGPRRAFLKPSDFIRLTSMAVDPYFRQPLTSRQYTDEAGYWFSDHDALYARYVSSGESFGFDSGLWPISFRKALAAWLAVESAERLTNSGSNAQQAAHAFDRAMRHAKSRDAMDEGVKFMPPSSWVLARGSGRDRRR